MTAGISLDGKYELVRQIGQGPVGTVYEARELAFDRRVAVKILNPGLSASSAARERFLSAARGVARLVHDNIVTVHDAGISQDKRAYLVMDYVEGSNLGELLAKKGCLLPSLACELLLQVLAALAVAHEQGVLHRDLKLENILLTSAEDGQRQVKVADFGISRATFDYDQRPVSERLSVASPRFTAPEQALGQHVDRRADIYSAGAILYELVTGRQLFEGTSPLEFLAKVVCGSFVPVKQIKPSVPGGLAKVVQAALETGTEQRISNAHLFASHLVAFVRRDPSDPERMIGRPVDPALKLIETTSPGNDLSDLPRASEPSEVSEQLLLSPTFPKTPGAPRVGSMRARARSSRHRWTNALRSASQARAALLATLAGSAIGALLAWLSSAH